MITVSIKCPKCSGKGTKLKIKRGYFFPCPSCYINFPYQLRKHKAKTSKILPKEIEVQRCEPYLPKRKTIYCSGCDRDKRVDVNDIKKFQKIYSVVEIAPMEYKGIWKNNT